jgi:hypothetical protein
LTIQQHRQSGDPARNTLLDLINNIIDFTSSAAEKSAREAPFRVMWLPNSSSTTDLRPIKDYVSSATLQPTPTFLQAIGTAIVRCWAVAEQCREVHTARCD